MKKRHKDANGRPIGVDNGNPILDSRMYEVKYHNIYLAAMAANVVAKNIFAQFDQEVNRFILINSIIDTRTDGTQTLQ